MHLNLQIIFFLGGLWILFNPLHAFLPISSKLSNHKLKTRQQKFPKQKPQNQTTKTPTPAKIPSSQIINAIAYRSPPSILISERKTQHFTEADFHFQLQWYVIAETSQIHSDTLYEAKIWGKTYVYWKHENQYYAIQNRCNHRGAFLSGGVLHPATNCVQCPYHGMEFDGDGILRNIPGQNIPPFSPPVWNQAKFPILEKEGWIYLNILPSPISETPDDDNHNHREMIFEELEASIPTARRVFYNIPSIPTYARIVSENLLDILHITYVHTFGNKESPVPLNEPEIYKMRDIDPPSIPLKYPYPPSQPSPPPPATPKPKSRTPPRRTISARIRAILFRNYLFAFLNGIYPYNSSSPSPSPSPSQINPLPPSKEPEPMKTPAKNQHYGIRYLFETNTQSMIRNIFQVNHILIETEFVLPHYTISRVRFGRYYKTVVSFALPVTETETHLFIKLYRNYWTRETIPSFPFPFSFFSVVIGLLLERMADYAMVWMLEQTFQEDAQILATLSDDGVQGSYHLKYDKFPFFYRNLYKKHVHPSSVPVTSNTNSSLNIETTEN